MVLCWITRAADRDFWQLFVWQAGCADGLVPVLDCCVLERSASGNTVLALHCRSCAGATIATCGRPGEWVPSVLSCSNDLLCICWKPNHQFTELGE